MPLNISAVGSVGFVMFAIQPMCRASEAFKTSWLNNSTQRVGGLENPPKHAYIIFEWSLGIYLTVNSKTKAV